MPTQYLIFGANSGIAQALISYISNTDADAVIYGISRSPLRNSHVNYIHTDYSDQSLKLVTEQLRQQKVQPSQIVICNGLLHTKSNQPEKKLEDINQDYFQTLMSANALTPLFCLQSVFPLLNQNSQCTITALSARVGSIEDNHLGGWYSYRASKAALNMMFKTAAIELSRRAKNANLILFHPGTTDTELSKPFQKNVPREKLFTPEFVAERLYSVITQPRSQFSPSDPAYLDWQGKPIKW